MASSVCSATDGAWCSMRSAAVAERARAEETGAGLTWPTDEGRRAGSGVRGLVCGARDIGYFA